MVCCWNDLFCVVENENKTKNFIKFSSFKRITEQSERQKNAGRMRTLFWRGVGQNAAPHGKCVLRRVLICCSLSVFSSVDWLKPFQFLAQVPSTLNMQVEQFHL